MQSQIFYNAFIVKLKEEDEKLRQIRKQNKKLNVELRLKESQVRLNLIENNALKRRVEKLKKRIPPKPLSCNTA